ncbi:hypothetical protein SLA2020_358700 [Shorea laevis]
MCIFYLCRVRVVDEAATLLVQMISQGLPPENAHFNSIIFGYSKAICMERAEKVIEFMKTGELKPDVYAYTAVISGYANGGQMDEACKMLPETKKKHPKLSPVTYHALIRGYCKLKEFDKALNLLDQLKDCGVQNVDEYNELIESLRLKALYWAIADKMLHDLLVNGVHPNASTKSLKGNHGAGGRGIGK